MSVKVFRVEGAITKPNYSISFSKDVRALKVEDAIERVSADFGSQHRVKRVHLKISSVNEISSEESRDPVIRELSEGVGE